MKFIDLSGRRFNNLIVIKRAYVKNGLIYWECLCDCGKTTYVSGGNLRSGQVKSCGCLRHKTSYNRRHNMSKTKLYKIWAGIKNRCYNAKLASYKNYGGRGIRMCDEWIDTPDVFFDWALSHGYEDNLSIERIDVNGNYCPENCTWIPKEDQAKNRRSCYNITYNNRTQNLQQWCDELNLPYKLVHNRMFKMGWSFERSILEKCHTEKRNTIRKEDCNG